MNGQEVLTEGCATEEAALAALDRILAGHVDPRTLPTLEAFWEQLLVPDGDFEHRYDFQTCNLYDTILSTTVRGSALGRARLDQIKQIDVQRHIDRQYKKYAESTVRRHGSCIRVVFGFAKEMGLLRDRMEGATFVPGNPADGVKYRKIPDAPSYIFSDEELVRYPELLYEYNPRLSAMVTVIADTGARPGEVCAMTTEDVGNGIWTIGAKIRRDGQRTQGAKGGKTRAIALTADAQAAIRDQGRARGLVFVNEDGNVIRPDALNTHLQRFRKWLQKREDAFAKEMGREPRPVPPLNPRNLRKTFVTRGVEMGDVKAVQAAVGHSSSRTTLDVYAKARLNPQKKLIESMQEGVSRSLFRDKGSNRGTGRVNDSTPEPTQG